MADTYEVTHVEPTPMIGPDGSYGPGHRVHFKTKKSGLTGHVEIPASQFAPDTVHASVAAAANTLEAVKNL